MHSYGEKLHNITLIQIVKATSVHINSDGKITKYHMNSDC